MEEAAKSFNKAMKGLGTDEARIIKEICQNNNKQRQEIKKCYLTMYGHTLEEDIRSEISGNFLDGVLALLVPTEEYEPLCLRNAMKGIGCNDKVLIEILCTKDGEEIKQLSNIYKRMFNRDLQKDIDSETSGDFGRVMRSLASGLRDSSNSLDIALAKKEAQELYDAGQGKVGTDEAEFIRILCSRNFRQLLATFEAYYQICQCDIEKAIKKEMSGNLEKALLAIVKTIRNKPGFYAELLNNSMRGIGTNNEDLIRLLVSRSEKDLIQIKAEYKRMFSKSLYDEVEKEISGNYKKLFLTLLQN